MKAAEIAAKVPAGAVGMCTEGKEKARRLRKLGGIIHHRTNTPVLSSI